MANFIALGKGEERVIALVVKGPRLAGQMRAFEQELKGLVKKHGTRVVPLKTKKGKK